MSLFGSLFSGVSALNAQSQSMSMIADNISNVNTIGYKASTARFETLVTSSATDTTFTPGGVRARTLALVDQQGLVQASTSSTDLAIAGQGFFVVNSLSDSSGSTLFTRAGSFRPDSLGNLVNSAGFFFQGWPLDSAGRLPGTSGNTTNTTSFADLASLETVNVNSISGVAAGTTLVSMGANLTASQVAFAGPNLTSISKTITAATDMATPFSIADGDRFTVTNGSGVTATFEYDPTPVSASGEFSTLTELAALINAVSGLTATIGGSTTDATLNIVGDDSRDDLVFTNNTNTPATAIFGASLTVAKTYDAALATKNLASGTVSAHFSRAVRVFDAQGTGHDLQISFLKVASNTWQVEVNANPATEVTTTSPLINGQIAVGTISFNGDGSLASIATGLVGNKSIAWTNGASAGSVSFNFGTSGIIGVGQTDGLSQFDGGFNVAFVNQNGSEVGELNGISINSEGFVIATFTNGQTQKVYKVPISTFTDVSRLDARNGNVFAQTEASGQFNLREAGKGGAGLVAPSALESANVDLGTEFTNMIITQRAFSASSKVITTVDDMLDELIRIKR